MEATIRQQDSVITWIDFNEGINRLVESMRENQISNTEIVMVFRAAINETPTPEQLDLIEQMGLSYILQEVTEAVGNEHLTQFTRGRFEAAIRKICLEILEEH